jgi:hypothetical protein
VLPGTQVVVILHNHVDWQALRETGGHIPRLPAMKIAALYILALALVVVAFSLALMFAKLAIVSVLFMVLALGALAWLTRSLMRKVRRTTLRPTA